MPIKTGQNLAQVSCFPLPLEAKIALDAEVRVIDAFVNQLNLLDLGFTPANKLGASAYSNADLLKLYLYGYLNRVRSSRRLQRECELNIELHWMLGGLKPKYHTIADFRKDHPKQLKAVFREYVLLMQEWDLIGGKRIAGDGTKIRGQNASKKNFTDPKLKRSLDRIETGIKKALEEFAARDEQEESELKTELQNRALEKIATLKERKVEYHKLREFLKEHDQTQISLTDPDCRSLVTKGTESLVGYNIQSVVDAENKVIVHVEATNTTDINAMSGLVAAAKENINIIKEAATNGVQATLGKHDVYPATYYSWKRKLQEQGEEGFRQGVTSAQIKEIRALEKENRQLKELVAEKELFIRALKEARVKKI